MRKFTRPGFTLIELLVVIAIIAILAAVLTPAVTQALLRGKAMGIASNARSMYQSIFAKEISDAAYISTSISFPKKGALNPGLNTFPFSTDYFRHVVTSEIMNVSFSFFAAPGIPAASGKTVADAVNFTDLNNAWCVTADVTDRSPEDLPFIFTRNLNIQTLNEGPVDGTGVKLAREGDDVNPFGEKAFVFVTKGGSSYALLAESIKPANFTNLFVTIASGPSATTNQVLRPN